MSSKKILNVLRRKKVAILLMSSLTICACGQPSSQNEAKRQKAQDLAKLLAMQSQVTDSLPPLVDISQRNVEIRYISKGDTVASRPIRLYIPEKSSMPMPLVYIPHYEMKDDALELRTYLSEGWAVASPTGFENTANGLLTDDDLVYNNAALYTLRNMEEFDPERTVLVGGSAGGYCSMMLAGLQMGICANIAQAPIENLYFNFYKHFNAADGVNNDALGKVLLKGLSKLSKGSEEEKAQALIEMMMELPLPFIGMVSGMFKPIQDNFPDKEDYGRWAALSPIGLADCYSNPFIVFHCTSDLLVPIDQTTRKYTYEKNGDSMPEGFSTRLDAGYPGILGKALDELLDSDLTCVQSIKPVPVGNTVDAPYDKNKPFNIVISDDGPVESYSSHNNGDPAGSVDMIPFLKEMMERGLSSTELLRPGKLRLLLERYAGSSIQLPAHEGIDDNVYGSLCVYRKEVVDELSRYASNHSVKEIDDMAASLSDTSIYAVWTQIKPLVEKKAADMRK